MTRCSNSQGFTEIHVSNGPGGVESIASPAPRKPSVKVSNGPGGVERNEN